MMIENSVTDEVVPDTAANYAAATSGGGLAAQASQLYPVFSLTNDSSSAGQPPNVTVTFSNTPQTESTAAPYSTSDAGGGTFYGWSPSSGTENPLFMSPIPAGQTIEATLSPDVLMPPYDNANAGDATCRVSIG
jgi:hypothetical protein